MKIGLSLGISRLSSGNGGGPTTFDASFTPIARLSNNNLTLTGGAGANYPMGRSTTTKTSGKYYMELYNPESTHFHIGVCLPTFPYSADGAFDSDNRQTSVTAFGSGSKDGATNTTGIASVQPEIGPYLQVAIDFDNRKIWIKPSGGTKWNGIVGDNPATNTGGYTFGTSLGVGASLHVFFTSITTFALTVNFGATTFQQTPPTGFVAWG